MPKTDALQGAMDLLVLKVLARRGPLHGYGIMTAIEEVSAEALRVEEGSLYPALHRIEEAGFIKASWVTKENGRRARVYELTRAGQEHLVTEEERWLAVSNAVRRVLRMA
jgi:PadR family transcriptional regulator, regulatory protein PadR